jgi:hypothetical protein
MLSRSSREALTLTALFAGIASQIRAANPTSTEAAVYETASRVAFLRAHALSSGERACRVLGESFHAAVYANSII